MRSTFSRLPAEQPFAHHLERLGERAIGLALGIFATTIASLDERDIGDTAAAFIEIGSPDQVLCRRRYGQRSKNAPRVIAG